MAVIDPLGEEEIDEQIKRLDEKMRRYTGASRMTPYVNAAARYPEWLDQLADIELTVMPSDALRRELKEVLAVAVSMVNNCSYCITAHSTLLKSEFGYSDRDLVEIAAATAHGAGLARFEQVFLDDVPLFEPVMSTEKGASEAAVEGLTAVEDTLDRIPIHYRVAANDPDYLAELLGRERVAVFEGNLDRRQKEFVVFTSGLAVGAPRLVRDRLTVLEGMGEPEAALMEACEVTELFELNTVWTSGLQLEPGVWSDGDG